MTFYLGVWLWPYGKVKKAYVIWCRLLHCMYLGTRFDVCECNSLRDISISSFFVTFDLHLWPSSSVKVIFFLINGWMLCCRILVPSMKLVCSIEFEILTIVWRKLKWRHHLFNFCLNSNTNLPRVFLNDIPNFISIGHKRAEIQSREVNRKLWRKNGYYVTMTLTFYPRSPIGFEPVW